MLKQPQILKISGLWQRNGSYSYTFKAVINTSTTFKNLGNTPELNCFYFSLPDVLFSLSLTQVRCEQGDLRTLVLLFLRPLLSLVELDTLPLRQPTPPRMNLNPANILYACCTYRMKACAPQDFNANRLSGNCCTLISVLGLCSHLKGVATSKKVNLGW